LAYIQHGADNFFASRSHLLFCLRLHHEVAEVVRAWNEPLGRAIQPPLEGTLLPILSGPPAGLDWAVGTDQA
jgi:hypothetical protein